jgi:hypothetical protein
MSAERLSDDLVRLTVAASEACRCQQPVLLHDPGCAVNASDRVTAALSRVEQERDEAQQVLRELALDVATKRSPDEVGYIVLLRDATYDALMAAVGREEDA